MEKKIESEKLRLKKAQEEAAKAASEEKTKSESQDAQNKAVKDEVPSQTNKPHTSAKST